jgi:ABC-type dipeptide/oligopeptide/nickel transport system permease component
MLAFIIRRLAWTLLVLLVVSFITFTLMHAVPGGPFDRERALPPEIIANLNQRYHLDWPLWKQYGQYVYDVFVPRLTATPPSNSLQDQFLIEVQLGSAYFRWMNFGPSYTSRSFGVSAPVIVLGPILVWLFGVWLKVLPVTGWGSRGRWESGQQGACRHWPMSGAHARREYAGSIGGRLPSTLWRTNCSMGRLVAMATCSK